MLLDNKKTGKVGDRLKECLEKGSRLSIISSLFSIYGFEALGKELRRVESVRLLNFYEFYNDLTDRITALNCAVHTGCYSLTTNNTEDTKTGEKDGHYHASETGNRLERLLTLERLQQEKAELRNRLKKEKNMGTQVELNTQVKKLSDRINEILDSGL